MATDVAQEVSQALAESREQPTSTTLHHAKDHEDDDSDERAVARE